MSITDQITIVKRIGKAWKNSKDLSERDTISPEQRNVFLEVMLTYRYALEFCGLTLNEIIALGKVEDLNKAVDELFSKSQVK